MATVVRRFNQDDSFDLDDSRNVDIRDDDESPPISTNKNRTHTFKSVKPKPSGRNWSLDDSNENSPSPPRRMSESSPKRAILSKDEWTSAGPGGSGKSKLSSSRDWDQVESKYQDSPKRSKVERKKHVVFNDENNNENCHQIDEKRRDTEPEKTSLAKKTRKSSRAPEPHSDEEYYGATNHRDSYDSKHGDDEEEKDAVVANDFTGIVDGEEDYEEAWGAYTYKNGVNRYKRSGRFSESKSSSKEDREMNTSEKAALENADRPFALVAHRGWMGHERVHCSVQRDRSTFSNKMYPTYQLILECTGQVILIAKKMKMNATSNYHLFDMTRGTAEKELTKKSCNYIGKLRAQNRERTHYVLVPNNWEREEVAGITFERQGVFQHLKDGSQPRKLKMVCPPLNADNMAIPLETKNGNSILDEMGANNSGSKSGYRFFHSKEPVYESGSYRLNFHGRVTMASVKNFQLVDKNDIDDVICQFGKVGEDKFTLDYKEPLNAMQSFCIALCQFNL